MLLTILPLIAQSHHCLFQNQHTKSSSLKSFWAVSLVFVSSSKLWQKVVYCTGMKGGNRCNVTAAKSCGCAGVFSGFPLTNLLISCPNHDMASLPMSHMHFQPLTTNVAACRASSSSLHVTIWSMFGCLLSCRYSRKADF